MFRDIKNINFDYKNVLEMYRKQFSIKFFKMMLLSKLNLMYTIGLEFGKL